MFVMKTAVVLVILSTQKCVGLSQMQNGIKSKLHWNAVKHSIRPAAGAELPDVPDVLGLALSGGRQPCHPSL